MKKIILILSITLTAVFAMKAFASMEIESINVDFANQKAMLQLQSGDFAVTNSVNPIDNSTVQTNSFVPDGGSITSEVRQPAFQQIFGSLIQAGAVNMDAVTNATMGITGASIAQQDTTIINSDK